MINHILVEAFCLKDTDRYAVEPLPDFCPNGGKYAVYQCLARKCPYVDFTSCEDTLCYIGPESDQVFGISYGGDMEEGEPPGGAARWQQLAVSKVREVYDTFMQQKTAGK